VTQDKTKIYATLKLKDTHIGKKQKASQYLSLLGINTNQETKPSNQHLGLAAVSTIPSGEFQRKFY
jgi:hypothetical protein